MHSKAKRQKNDRLGVWQLSKLLSTGAWGERDPCVSLRIGPRSLWWAFLSCVFSGSLARQVSSGVGVAGDLSGAEEVVGRPRCSYA